MNVEIPAAPTVDSPLAFMARVTPQLRSAVTNFETTLPAAEFVGLVSVVRSAFEKYRAKLLEFAPGVARGTALHDMMERELSASSQIPISCRRGCSGCCHYEVEITQDEAAILRDIVLGGLAIDSNRLALQAARERQSAEWRRFGSADNRCVFLAEDGACRIYEDRPSICRKHVVTTPAAACTTEGAAVAPVQVLLAEILLSAALSLENTAFGSLARMLTQSLHEDALRRSAGRSPQEKNTIMSVETKSHATLALAKGAAKREHSDKAAMLDRPLDSTVVQSDLT